MATVMSKERWLRFHEAVAVVRQRHPGSIGMSEALVKAAVASGEVRLVERGVQDFSLRSGSAAKKITLSNMDDLIDWLRRHVPEEHPPAAAVSKGRRYVEDDALVATGAAGVRQGKWPNALQAATALAGRAQGSSPESTIARLRKKISAAVGG
ncbi:MAG: hypothetical protein WBF58_18715 [Xanthobacteraceae bacterium]